MLTLTDFLVVTLSVLTVVFFSKKRSLERPSILNVYTRPNVFYYLKVAFMFTVMEIRKFVERKKDVKHLEGHQKLRDDKRAVDAVYFNSTNKKGDFFVCGTARRANKLIDGFITMKIFDSNLGTLTSPLFPDTTLYQTENETGYSVSGLEITCEEPLKKWKIHYEGDLKVLETGRNVKASLELTYTTSLPVFNFDEDVDSLLMAKAIAKEMWTKEYFNTLKEIHQIHYEQPGTLEGSMIVGGKKYEVRLDCARDHTVGVREWRNFHRYILHYIFTDNGDAFAVLLISMPICFSYIQLGYVYSAQENKMFPLQSCDLELYQLGEFDHPVEDYAFTIKAGGKYYTIEVKLEELPQFFISKDWECKVYEGIGSFRVNGVKGWGGAEWEYRNVNGRNVKSS